jgi:hypothetical protein
MCTWLYTQTSHRFNWHAGLAAQLGPPVMHTQRDKERGGADLLPRCWGKQTEEAAWSGQLGLAAAGDGGGRAGRLHGCEARLRMLAVWVEVARGLLATDAGGCGRGHLRQASTGGSGPRRRGARASVGLHAPMGPASSTQGSSRWLGHMRSAASGWLCRRWRLLVEIGRDEHTRGR